MENRIEELEKELEVIQNKIENPPEGTSKERMDFWKKELDSLSFELNNLYDEDEDF